MSGLEYVLVPYAVRTDYARQSSDVWVSLLARADELALHWCGRSTIGIQVHLKSASFAFGGEFLGTSADMHRYQRFIQLLIQQSIRQGKLFDSEVGAYVRTF